MHKVKILIVSCVFPPELVTSARTSLDVANGLAQLGASVTVLCPRPSRSVDDSWKFKIDNTVNVVHLPSLGGGQSILMKVIENLSFALSAITYLILKKSFDICYMNAWPIISTSLIATVLRIKKTHYIYSVQDLYPKTLAIKGLIKKNGFFWKLFLKLEKTLCKNSAKIITISDSFKNYLINSIEVDAEKVTVVSNWSSGRIILQDKEKAWGMLSKAGVTSNSQELVLGYGGNISESTGISDFSKFIVNSSLNIQLIVAGSGSLVNEIRGYVHSDERISLLTPWPKSLTNSVYSVSDILVLPVPVGQEHGSLPSKLINYMNSNKPILCVCDSECEITQGLEKYPAASICSWAELENIKINNLKELSSLDSFSFFSDSTPKSEDKLIKEILKFAYRE